MRTRAAASSAEKSSTYAPAMRRTSIRWKSLPRSSRAVWTSGDDILVRVAPAGGTHDIRGAHPTVQTARDVAGIDVPVRRLLPRSGEREPVPQRLARAFDAEGVQRAGVSRAARRPPGH